MGLVGCFTHPGVAGERGALREGARAQRAGVRALAGVAPRVRAQAGRAREGEPARAACVGPLARVAPLVVAQRRQRLRTQGTSVNTLRSYVKR